MFEKALQKLRERETAVDTRMDALEKLAEERDDGAFNKEEDKEYESLTTEKKEIVADFAKYKARIDAKKKAEVADWLDRRNLDEPGQAADTQGDAAEFNDGTRITQDGDSVRRRVFPHLGAQLAAIFQAAQPGAVPDDRLIKVHKIHEEKLKRLGIATGGSARVGTDAGFLIEETDAGEMFNDGMEMTVLASRCDSIPIGAGSDRLRYWQPEKYDRTTGNRWGGVTVQWAAEADSATASKPKLTRGELPLDKLIASARASDEEMEDVVQLGAIFRSSFSEEFAWTVDDSILVGTGVGQPLGILNADALVTVPIETGQQAGEIEARNINKMWGRLPQRFRRTAAWFINGEIEEKLPEMQIGTGASGQLVYMPPGGLSGSDYGTLKARPVIPVEQCPALNSVGDIVLADLQQYVLITKGGLRGDVSMHVYFNTHEQAFRWVLRINGMPKLRDSITPAKATAGRKLSAYITLAARS